MPTTLKRPDSVAESRTKAIKELLQGLTPSIRAKATERLEQMPIPDRLGHLRCITGKASPRQAIRAQCLECVGWVRDEVSRCSSPLCSLYPYRPFQ